MKVKLPFVLFLLTSQLSISQIDKTIKGKVSSEGFLLQKVDVINKTSKKSTITNEKGEFIIEAKAYDNLIFYAKEFQSKEIKLRPDQIEQNNLDIIMFKKPEELDEVVVKKIAPVKIGLDKKWEQQKNDAITLDRKSNTPKTGVYDGSIENGIDFMRIGKMIVGLFGKGEEKEEKEALPKIEFAELAKNICEEKFYLETLKLKSDEIDLFLQFCDADPKSKSLITNHNKLSMMDFLMAKNKEFKNLPVLK
ncbi:carboxypeptidase-like regulatory domain-containing protein [Flavobacterium aquiphilum]|uniref:carboxypeptidase-like regulatory domain-containing protein n=1 Tax=Flavobacterium aquiphilum TaxID=3003261 RepID=UPI00247FCA06|nr:carboxypeptidase-like regulatory domain-containing protein [Flavobacterium aquiphilum]